MVSLSYHHVLVLGFIISLCEWWCDGAFIAAARTSSHWINGNPRISSKYRNYISLIGIKKSKIRNCRTQFFLNIKGGWSDSMGDSAINEGKHDNTDGKASSSLPEQQLTPVTILVSTSFGTPFLDKKKKLQAQRSLTVRDLKTQIEQKFPGLPPSGLQRLFYGSRLLSDNETIGEVMAESQLPALPILLDMITGTASYNKTLSVTQSIDAYVSTVVHLTYLSDKVKMSLPSHSIKHPADSRMNDNSGHASSVIGPDAAMETLYYRQLYDLVNSTIYERYADDIAYALDAERNPEMITDETKSWRGENKKNLSPLAIVLAKEFDLNLTGIKNFLYYSLALLVSDDDLSDIPN